MQAKLQDWQPLSTSSHKHQKNSIKHQYSIGGFFIIGFLKLNNKANSNKMQPITNISVSLILTSKYIYRDQNIANAP